MLSGSFVKALKGVLDTIPKMIKVTFKHVSGYEIGMVKINSRELPEKFKRPVIIEAFNRPWRVLKAEPYKNFAYKRKLTLVVVEPGLADKTITQFFYPTIAGTIPETVPHSEYEDFVIYMAPCDWRQVELLPSSLLPLVSGELEIIDAIRNPEKGTSVLSGYEKRYVRENIEGKTNNIPLQEFCKLLDRDKLGAVRMDSLGFVKDGFAMQSGSFTYYGTMQNNIIKDLCIYKFDFVDSELLTVLSAFDLLMANWCEGKMLTAEVTESTADIEVPVNGQVNF